MSTEPKSYSGPAPQLSLARAQSLKLQRACDCGKHTMGGGECEGCKGKVQRSSAVSSTTSVAPPIVHRALGSAGQPLDTATRTFMEPRFGHDFSAVRVHTDATAVESARAVSAQAYTVGNDIVFDAGRYTPGTPAGQKLLAHELAHVAQQGGTNQGIQGKLNISQPDDASEIEADRAAESVMRSPEGAAPFKVNASAAAATAQLHRSCDDGRCETCAGGRRDFWVTVFFRRRATQDTMNKLRTEINGAKAILSKCCLDLKFDFNWTLLPGGGSLPAFQTDASGNWHYTADEQALGTGNTFSGARGVPMLVVDDVPLSGGGVTVDPRFDTTYTGKDYFAIGINQTSTPNPNCNHIAHELWHVGSGNAAHDPANGTVTSCTGSDVSALYCRGLRNMVGPVGDFPDPPRGPGATRVA